MSSVLDASSSVLKESGALTGSNDELSRAPSSSCSVHKYCTSLSKRLSLRNPLNGFLSIFLKKVHKRQFWKVEVICLKKPADRSSRAGNKQLIDARASVSPWQTDHSSISEEQKRGGHKSTATLPISRNFGSREPLSNQSHWSWHKHLRLSLGGIHGIPRSIRSPLWRSEIWRLGSTKGHLVALVLGAEL